MLRQRRVKHENLVLSNELILIIIIIIIIIIIMIIIIIKTIFTEDITKLTLS